MAGPSELIRQNMPAVAASSGGVGGNDGYLTAQQYEELLAGSGGGGAAFQYTVIGGDNDDFIVAIPAADQPTTENYVVNMTIQSGSIFTLHRIPFADQTTTQFRVLTDGTLAVGTLLGFTITEF